MVSVTNRHAPLTEQYRMLCAKLRGYYHYSWYTWQYQGAGSGL